MIQLGSSKTVVTNATFSGGDYTFTIGKGSIKVTGVGSDTTISIVDYNGKVTLYTDATKTSASAFIERDYIEDTWFTSVDSSSVDFVEVDDFISKTDEFGIVSGDDKGVPLLESNYRVDNELLSIDIKGSGGLIKNED